MDDIVTRIREEIDSLKVDVQVLRDAANEIERLRAAGDALAEALTDARRRHPCDCADRYDHRTGTSALRNYNAKYASDTLRSVQENHT